VIVLDAYPVVALLGNEPAAAEIGQLILHETAVIPAPNLAEAIDQLGRGHRIAEDRTRSAIESLQESTDLRIRPVDERAAWRAGTLRVRHYRRRDCPVSIADCLLLAVTGPEDRVATADPQVLAVAQAEGIAWIALPDSTGQRHPPA